MPKRFFATEIWNDPWFVDLPDADKLLWIYILSTCDCAGIWHENFKAFNAFTETKSVSLKNLSAELQKIGPKKWFVKNFLSFQYGDRGLIKKPLIALAILRSFMANSIKVEVWKPLYEAISGPPLIPCLCHTNAIPMAYLCHANATWSKSKSKSKSKKRSLEEEKDQEQAIDQEPEWVESGIHR